MSSDKRHASYENPREDILSHIESARKVLDLGCANGNLARALKRKLPAAKVWGIDSNETYLAETRDALEEGFALDLSDLQALRSRIGAMRFDLVICGDVIEHTPRPVELVRALYDSVEAGGRIVISLPNVAHWELLLHLLRLRWPRRERGIFDSTHLAFFMLGNLRELVPAGGELKLLSRNFRLREKGDGRFTRRFLGLLSWVPYVREFVTFQYIFEIRKPGLSEPAASRAFDRSLA